MAVNYAELVKKIQATPLDSQADASPTDLSFSDLEKKYGGGSVSTLDTTTPTPIQTGAPEKPGGFFTGVARAVAPLGDAIGSALGTFGAKKMEADTAKRQEELSNVAISLIRNKNLSADQKARALKALQISQDTGVIAQSGAFNTTGRQVAGQALGTLGSVVAGGGSALASRLGLKGAAGIAARALGEGIVTGSTIGAGAGLAKGDGSTWSEALKTGAIAASFPVLGATFGKALPKMANALERINLRLTPTQKINLGSKLDEVTNLIRKEKLVGTPEARFEKMTDIYRGMERKIQSFLGANHNIKIPREKILQELEDLKVG